MEIVTIFYLIVLVNAISQRTCFCARLNFPTTGGRSYDDVLRMLDGEFDNIAQHRSYSMSPGKKLHEFVTAVFTKHPLYQNSILCSYFYAKNSSDVFRFRLYEFKDDRSVLTLFKKQRQDSKEIIMKIYRPSKKCEDNLRRNSYNLSKWVPQKKDFDHLKGCDVRWVKIADKKRREDCYRGDLVNGCCYVCSQSNPNLRLKIKDELRLWTNELWINDRVYLPSGQLIIGNDKNIPYKLKRV